VVCVHNSYGLGHLPHQDEFVRTCVEKGVAFVPLFAISGSGREAGAGGTEHNEVWAIARAHQAAAWVRLFPDDLARLEAAVHRESGREGVGGRG
jgi:hypothetical protein